MVRTRAFDPSEALSRAVDLFLVKGYSNTSMEDIVSATGVSRYGLYGTFGNKRELFEKALEAYADRMGRRSFLKLLEPDASIADIRRIFEERIEAMAKEGGMAKGCLFTYTATELAPRDREIEGILQRFLKRMAKTFTIGLETAQARGEVPRTLDVKAAGEFLTGAMFGLGVMARAGMPRETLERFVDSTLASLR
jgi:TetR/AcrR family transcriptional repressor of nem operon